MTTQDLTAGFKRNPVAVICGVLCVAFIAAIFLRNGLVAEAETTLEAKTAEGQKYATNIQYSAQLKDQVDAVTAANKEIESRIIRASQMAMNMGYFYKLENDTKIKMIDSRQLTPASVPKPAKGAFLPVSFAVAVQGDLNLVLTFLRQVENGVHYARINNATLSGNAVQRGAPLTLSLSVDLLGTQ